MPLAGGLLHRDRSNCSAIGVALPLTPLREGFEAEAVQVVTMPAVSRVVLVRSFSNSTSTQLGRAELHVHLERGMVTGPLSATLPSVHRHDPHQRRQLR